MLRCRPKHVATATQEDTVMIAVVFEVTPADGRRTDYLAMAAALRSDLEGMPGFVSVERFESLTNPGKLLSLSVWQDEEALRNWRCHGKHRDAQHAGRNGIFAHYRLRVAGVLRDYEIAARRDQAPPDAPF
jgi:heme-degrading monooxygenase HmoA